MSDKVHMMTEAFITVSGKVQTVGFRDFVKQHADELGLFGYVQNQDDGSVEVLVQGEKEHIESLLEKLWKGPVFSEVKNIMVEWHVARSQDPFLDFDIWK